MISWQEEMAQDAWKEAQGKILAARDEARLAAYQEDPVSFMIDELGAEILTDDIKRVAESVLENPVTIAKSGNATGKTFGAARIAAWFFKVFNDSQVFLAAAPPLDNLKMLLWGEVASVVRKNPSMFDGYKKRSLYLERHEQSYIRCLTIPQTGSKAQRESKFSGKHAPHLLFIVDEGDAVPDEVYSGIESCMSGGMARLLIMFNPRHKAGAVYHKERNRSANIVTISALDHPNVITGKDMIPGAVDRDTTVRRINEWTREMKPDEDPEKFSTFEVPDYLVEKTTVGDDGNNYKPLPPGKRIIIEPAFSYMVLGRYPAQSQTQLINETWIRNAIQRRKVYIAEHGHKPEGRPKMGLDVAELGSDYNMACFRYGGFVDDFNHYWNNIDTDETAMEAFGLYKKKNAAIAYVDGTSWGSSVAPAMSRKGRELNQDVRAISVKSASSPEGFISTEMGEFYRLRDQLYWAMRMWLKNDSTAMLPDDPELVEELLAFEYSVKNGEIKMSNKDTLRDMLKRSPDKADALSLTFSPYERPKFVRLGQ